MSTLQEFRKLQQQSFLNLLRRHKDRNFIETGSCDGLGIDFAIKAGFKEIRSVELDKDKFDAIIEKYKGVEFERFDLLFYKGSSIDHLANMIEETSDPLLFWLDAHDSEGDNDNGLILKELAIIADYAHRCEKVSVELPIIIIDDFVMFFQGKWETSIQQIEAAVKKINPQYAISYYPITYNGCIYCEVLS